MHPIFPLALMVLVGSVLIGATIRSLCSATRRASLEWVELIERLQPVDVRSLDVVARDFLVPTRDQLKLEPTEIWTMVGGWEGLRRMHENTEIMLALAAHTQRWNFDEGVIVTERMRRDAVKLRRAVWRLKLNRVPGLIQILPSRFRCGGPFEVHEIASAYHLMRQRLLALYETSHAGLYPTIAASV